MKYLRNIKPFEPIKMKDMISHSGNTIASKALVDNEKHEVRFFHMQKEKALIKNIIKWNLYLL